MSKRPARKTQRDIYKSNIKKLQRAGLIGKVNLSKKATPAIVRRLEKYRSVLIGKATTVKAPDEKTARRLRKTLGLKGSGKTIVVPREKHERYSFEKSTGDIVSKRKGYNEGEIIHKRLGQPFPAAPPDKNSRLYYTIPARTRGAGALKRKTFSSFDEMLYYLSRYEVEFEDIENRIEIEEIKTGSTRDIKLQQKIHEEREAGRRRLKRRKARAKKAKR